MTLLWLHKDDDGWVVHSDTRELEACEGGWGLPGGTVVEQPGWYAVPVNEQGRESAQAMKGLELTDPNVAVAIVMPAEKLHEMLLRAYDLGLSTGQLLAMLNTATDSEGPKHEAAVE